MSRTNLENTNNQLRVKETRRADGSLLVEHFFDLPSKTDQSFKKDCDINLMVKRFTKANRMNNAQFMEYMKSVSPNFSTDGVIDGTVPELQVHLDNTIAADRMFMSLPSELRARFKNDPAQFLDFVFEPSNRAELATMGLMKPEAVKRLKEASEAANAAKTPSAAASSSAAKVPFDQTST